MKSYNQFREDIETKRQELKQRQQDQMKAANDAIQLTKSAEQEAKQRKQEREDEKEEIKGEIKQELSKEFRKQLGR